MTLWPYLCIGAAILAASVLIWSLCRAAATTREVVVNEDTL